MLYQFIAVDDINNIILDYLPLEDLFELDVVPSHSHLKRRLGKEYDFASSSGVTYPSEQDRNYGGFSPIIAGPKES